MKFSFQSPETDPHAESLNLARLLQGLGALSAGKPRLGRKSRVRATLPRKCEKCEGKENFPFYRAGRELPPFPARPFPPWQPQLHLRLQIPSLGSSSGKNPAGKAKSEQSASELLSRAGLGQRRAALPVLPIKKTLTNILPRFNVHLFLTRGTYSIKISY